MSSIPSKDAFELLYVALSGYQSGFFESAFKVTASLLIIVGWVTRPTKLGNF